MPRPNRNYEKPKNFFGSLKRLIKSLDTWKYILALCLILALISSLLSIVLPSRLSMITDTIKEGVNPSEDKVNLILEKSAEKIINNIGNPAIIKILEPEEVAVLQDVIGNYEKIEELDENLLYKLTSDIDVDGIVINREDQVLFIKNIHNKDYLLSNMPDTIKKIIEPKVDLLKVKNIAITLGIIYLLAAVFNYIQNYYMATVSNRFAKQLRSDVTNKINRLPLKYFDQHVSGDLLSRVTNDIDNISQSISNSLAITVTSLTLFIGSIIMMFVTNYIMALTAIIASIIGISISFVILMKSQKYFIRRQKELGELNGYIEEMYSSHDIVKAYNGEKSTINRFDKLNNKLYTSNFMSGFLSGLAHPIMGFVGNLGFVAVCVVGALLVNKNMISFGVIIAFIMYVRLFTNPLSQMAQVTSVLQSIVASSERIFEFLDEEEMSKEENKKKLDKKKAQGNIIFDHVKFGYDKKTIIHDFNANIKKGSKIAIVGPTGAGKTTLVNLLMKFYDIKSGDILIDGISIKELSRDNIHDLFSMVLQDTWFFEGTIKENIMFNNYVSEEEIWKALRLVGAYHFVKSLPNGLDCLINDNDNISGGQRQLFTIARAMIEDAPFLILDEATSNVDTRTEELVQKAMDKLMKNRTSFIIAHRLSTIKNADYILVMNEGNIVEQGTHEELMNKNGFYADLYNSQFEL